MIILAFILTLAVPVNAAEAVVYGLIADKCITCNRHNSRFFTKITNYFLLRNKTAHLVFYFAP